MVSHYFSFRLTGEPTPTEERLNEISQQARGMFLGMMAGADDKFEQIVSEIRKNVRDQMMGEESYLEIEHELWLNAAKENITWTHWARYRDYLTREKFWNDRLIGALDNTSDKILDLMGDPRSDKPFARRRRTLPSSPPSTAISIGLGSQAISSV